MLVCSELGREGNADILRFSFFHGSQSHTPVATPELHNRSSVASGFCFILFFLTVGIQEGGVLCVGVFRKCKELSASSRYERLLGSCNEYKGIFCFRHAHYYVHDFAGA